MKKNVRGPRAQQTREKLLDAGRKAFAAKGLGGASLREDILAPAGVSAGSFYHQFSDKADLLAEILRTDGARVIEAMTAQNEQGLGNDAATRGSSMIDYLFERAEKNPYFVKIFVREYYSDSPIVQREIRLHTRNTMDRLKLLYDRLGERLGTPLDTESLAIIVTNQIFSVLNYYVGLSKKERTRARPALLRGMMLMMVGGIPAVKRPEGEGAESGSGPASETRGEGAG